MSVQNICLHRVNTNKLDNIRYNNLSLLKPQNCDVVTFSGTNKLYKKYKINPDEVKIVATSEIKIDRETKVKLIEKILEAHEHAQKNFLWGNIAKAGYATNIGLANGSWHLATNFNNTRNEISAICGERSTLLGAYNDTIKKLSLTKLKKNKTYINKTQKGFQATYLAMSSYKPIGTDKNAASPCVDCLSWFNTDRIFKDNTRVASLEKDENSSLCLKIKTLKEMLPYRNEKESIINCDKKIRELGFDITPDATEVMKKKNISNDQILKLIEEAKNTHDSNECTDFSTQNIGASVLTNKGDIITGKKIDWSKRWFMEPAEFAISKAVENSPKNTIINAMAYYGKGIIVDENGIEHRDGVVSLETLGRVKTKYGSSETLVLSVIDDKIAVRTIDNYMPEKFSFIQDYLKQK